MVGASGTHELRLYAHRGANRVHPENTLPAFRRALEDGATHLEMDVHRTLDGHLIVHHDPTGERMAGVGAEVCASTLDEIQRWDVGARFPGAGESYRAPLLEEVFDAFPDVPLNIDVKHHTLEVVSSLVELVNRFEAASRVLITSFNSALIEHARHAGFSGETGSATADLLRLKFWPRFLAQARRFFTDGHALQVPLHGDRGRGLSRLVGRHIRFDTKRLIERAHRLGLRVDYWVINEPEEAERLLALGADGIMTDEPAALRPVFQDHARNRGLRFPFLPTMNPG